MKKRVSLPILLGVLLIAVGLCLLVTHGLRQLAVQDSADRLVARLDGLLPPGTPGMIGMHSEPAMPVLQVEGTDCVALLEIPAFALRLPVTDAWHTDGLPARFSGSVYDGTLVIGGTDHPGQFDFCARIENGEMVVITDMTGAQFTYTVARVDRAQHAEAGWLSQPDFALTLFCRDAQTLEYIAVRCTP